MTTIKEIAKKEQTEKFIQGHRMCAGCAAPIVVKTILSATDKPVVAACATGCLEVASTIYPFSSWKIPFIHSAFENASATISGVEAAYKALMKKKEINKEIKFIVFGGDGGTYDIGLQSLSGALERRHDFVYVCYDNGAYSNTGGQRSSATPFGANTTTQPAGEKSFGKNVFRKDLMKIVAAHNISYCAQASVSNLTDLFDKAKKAFETKGPSFLNVLTPCINMWKVPMNKTVEVARLAVETNFWPLYEIENGKYKINYEPEKRRPVEEFLKMQGRFGHLFSEQNTHIIGEIQENVDKEWEKLLELCKL